MQLFIIKIKKHATFCKLHAFIIKIPTESVKFLIGLVASKLANLVL